MKRAMPLIFRAITVIILSTMVTYAQGSRNSAGLEKLRSKDFTGAIKILKDSEDAIGLRILGLSYESIGKKKDAVKSFKRSFEAGYREFELLLDKWRNDVSKPAFSTLMQESEIFISTSLASLESAMALEPKAVTENEWRHKASVLINVSKVAASGKQFYRYAEVDQDIKVLAKPRPPISAASCVERANLDVTVQLLAFFFDDGKTMFAIPLSTWRKYCNEASLIAANGIKFNSAIKEGKPVGSIRMIEYSYSLR